MNASSVSRQLRRAGFRPIPAEGSRMREGISVRRAGISDSVFITISFDSLRHVEESAAELIPALEEMGYAVRRPYPHLLRVSKETT